MKHSTGGPKGPTTRSPQELEWRELWSPEILVSNIGRTHTYLITCIKENINKFMFKKCLDKV